MSIFLYVEKQERKRGIFMLLNSIVAVVIIVIAIFTVKKYKMSMKYGCCGSADSGEGRRVEVAEQESGGLPLYCRSGYQGDDLRKLRAVCGKCTE